MARTKVLLVDDSRTELAVASAALKQAGYALITAADGDQALAVAAAEQPDVVVLDIVMPRKNGYQVCRALKSQPLGVPKVLMLSTKHQESDRFWALKQGADMYMTKPFAPADLVANVEALARG